MKRYHQLIPVLLLCGCSLAPTLPKDTAASLLLQFARGHCTIVPAFASLAVQWSNENLQWQQAQSAIAWFDRNVASGTDYSLVKRETENPGNCVGPSGDCRNYPGQFRYIFADKTTGCQVVMAGSDYGTAWPNDDAATITARLDDPSAINILDITVDKETGKSADVVFTVTTEPSLFARKAADGLSVLSQYRPAAFAPDPTKQYHAHLQKLDAAGWEVVSSDFFQPASTGS